MGEFASSAPFVRDVLSWPKDVQRNPSLDGFHQYVLELLFDPRHAVAPGLKREAGVDLLKHVDGVVVGAGIHLGD